MFRMWLSVPFNGLVVFLAIMSVFESLAKAVCVIYFSATLDVSIRLRH